jgi:hypothetical protein
MEIRFDSNAPARALARAALAPASRSTLGSVRPGASIRSHSRITSATPTHPTTAKGVALV